MLTLLAPIMIQGSEHWVFVERNTSGLEELALKQISDIQKEETRTGASEQQPTLDLSNVTTTVREVKMREKQEESPSEESKALMHKRAKMIASPEDFESLWEDDMYEKENRKHSSETDSQTTEERDVQKDKKEEPMFTSTESEEEKELKYKIEGKTVGSSRPGLAEEEKTNIEAMAVASSEPKEREIPKNKMGTAAGVSPELELPTQPIKEPGGKTTEDFQAQKIESWATSWPESTKEENKIIIQEHRTVWAVSDKEALKTTSDFQSMKTKVKLSDKAVYSATERIIYIGADETNQQDNEAEKIPDNEKLCSFEKKQENQRDLSRGGEEIAMLAADSEKDDFQSSSFTSTEGKPEISKPIISSDLSDENTEDDKIVQPLKQCTSKKKRSSPIIKERGSMEPVVYGTKDYRDCSSCHSEENSSKIVFHISTLQLKSGSLTKEDEPNLSSKQAHSTDETHKLLQDSGKVSDEKRDIATSKADIKFTISETQRKRNELGEMEVSQILLQMEEIEATKPSLDPLSQQCSCTEDISKGEGHKTQDLRGGEIEKGEALDSSKPPQSKLSKAQESAQNKSISSEKSTSDNHSDLDSATKDESPKMNIISTGRFQVLEDEANANYIEVDQMAKYKPPPSEQSMEGKSSFWSNNSEVKKTAKAGSSAAGRNEFQEIDKFTKEELQELDKNRKVGGTAMDKITEFEGSAKDKHYEVEGLTKCLQNSVAATLDSEEQEHDRSNFKKPPGDYCLSPAGSPDSEPPELRRSPQDNSLLKDENGAVNVVLHQTWVAEENREFSQPSDMTAQSREQLLTFSGKQKPDLQPLKCIPCGTCTAVSPEIDKDVALSLESHRNSLLHRTETNENISIASKRKMFEQSEKCSPLFDEQHEEPKKSQESYSSGDTQKDLPNLHIELQKDIPVEKNSSQIKSPLGALDSKAKDLGETSDVTYLAVAQGPSDGEPSQPSSWKEDISVGSEEGEGEAELASPDSGCEITLAEAVVTP